MFEHRLLGCTKSFGTTLVVAKLLLVLREDEKGSSDRELQRSGNAGKSAGGRFAAAQNRVLMNFIPQKKPRLPQKY